MSQLRLNHPERTLNVECHDEAYRLLKCHINDMRSMCKSTTLTEMVKSGVSISTLQRFMYAKGDKAYAIRFDNLVKISRHLDNCVQFDYYEIRLNRYISITVKSFLKEVQPKTLKQAKVYPQSIDNMANGYNYFVSTLIKYVDSIQQIQKGDGMNDNIKRS